VSTDTLWLAAAWADTPVASIVAARRIAQHVFFIDGDGFIFIALTICCECYRQRLKLRERRTLNYQRTEMNLFI
jgi:hypothetical protein